MSAFYYWNCHLFQAHYVPRARKPPSPLSDLRPYGPGTVIVVGMPECSSGHPLIWRCPSLVISPGGKGRGTLEASDTATGSGLGLSSFLGIKMGLTTVWLALWMQQVAWGPITATRTGEPTDQSGRKRDREMRDGVGKMESMQRRALAWPVPEALLHTPWPLCSVGLLHLFLKANTDF